MRGSRTTGGMRGGEKMGDERKINRMTDRKTGDERKATGDEMQETTEDERQPNTE